MGRGPRKNKQPERLIETAILDYLNGIPDCYAWKNTSVGAYNKAAGRYLKPRGKYRITGISDILGVFRGAFLAVEVKSLTGRPTKNQLDFIEDVRSCGGIAFVARSVDEVRRNLEREQKWWAGDLAENHEDL